MRHVKRSRLERGLISLLCMVVLLSFLPEVPLTAFAAEESEVTGETDDTLTHQTICTAPDDSGSGQEQITLDGLMPPDAEVSVQPCDALPAEHLCAYDISITDANGDEFQPETGTSIQVRIENPAIGEAAAQEQNLRLWHIGDDGVREEIQHFRIRGDSIEFDATGFSIYEVDNGTPPLRTYYFKIPTDPANNTDYQLYYFPTTGVDAGGHNKMICQQTIKNGEIPIFPQLPADISSRYTFMGWYRWENGTLSDTPFDFSQIDPVTENETVILHAVFRSCVYAIFHDQYNGKSRNFPIMATRRGCLSAASGTDVYGNPADALAEISLKDLHVVYDDEEQSEGTPPRMAFMGWTIIPPEYAVSNDAINQYIESNNVEVIQEDTIQISGTTRLYPVFETICWLEFNTNQFVQEGQAPRTYVGATYKPPLYFSPDDGFRFDEGETSKSAPICAGYEFQGWYTAQGDQVTDASLNLVSGLDTEEIEVRDNRLYFKQISGKPKVQQVDLYAKWKPVQSAYTVVVWRQKESDDKDAAEKTYDFAESHTFSAATEELVSVEAQFQNLTSSEYTGFYYASCDDPKKVAGNGSTVLNVYYDRCTVTYQFYSRRDQAGSNNATPQETWDGLYGQKIAKYGYEWKSSDAWYYYKGSSYYSNGTGITYLEAFNSITSAYSDYNATSHQYTTKIYKNGSNSSSQIIHVFQGLDGTYDLNRSDLVYTTNSPTEDFTFNFTNKFEGFLVYGYSKGNFTPNPPNNAVDENEANPGDRDKSVSLSGQNLYVYHKRRSHELKFVDSRNSGTVYKIVNVLYQQPLTGYPPMDPDTPPEEGYTFSGWFHDQNCSSGTRVDFDALTMPNANMIVYAGWETEWFKVEIDPNGGVLTGTQATWFWEPFNGDPIEEYKTVTRNYEPDAYGDYYYALRNRDYYHLGEEWDPREDTDYKLQIVDGHCTRGAFYTTDNLLASDATRYKAADSAYRYLGWYEVDPETGEEKPYHFGTRITKNTYLKLHWKQLGTYFISYHAGAGTIDNQDKNEQTFEFLDADDYTDHADVVVTRVAIPPKGKNFVGWRIRTDPTGTIYYPGQSFRFSSSYAVTTSEIDETGQIVVKRNIVLDAVYQDIDNAKIIYDPNGGTVDTRALELEHAGGQDASRAPAVETDGSPYPLTTDVQIQDNRLVVSDLLNNTAVILADGVGFTNPGYTFVGWSTSKNGIGGTDYQAGSVRYYADNKDTVILYAKWEFRVYYDKNNANAPDTPQGWGGDWRAAGYGWDPVKHLYYTTLRLGEPASRPNAIPVSNNDKEMFKYWSVIKQDTIGVMETPFDFAQPITQELVEQYAGSYTDSAGNSHKQLTLYGCWDAPIRIPVHIVDTSSSEWELRDDWLQDGVTDIILRHDEISLASAADALNYADGNKLDGMTFAFACTAGNHTDVQTISDERTITSIWYDAEDMRVKVRYPDGSVHDFDTSAQTPEAVYLVYYKDQAAVPIHYENMSLEGVLTAVSPLSSDAPRTAEITGDSYAMQDHVVQPCAWATSADNTPQYYSFAIGSPNASDASGLQIITDYAENDDFRPVLYLRHTWQGLAYSLDGTEWREGGYDQHLYVIYYKQRPTVVNLTEHTIGLPEDMADTFDYQITVTLSETRTVERHFYTRNPNGRYRPANGYPTSSENEKKTSDISVQTVTLGDHDVKSIVLFYAEIPDSMDTTYDEYTVVGNTTIYYLEHILDQKIQQSVTIRQTPNTAYTTVNDAADGDHVYQSAYTAVGSDTPVTITYTNTRRLEKQVHIAIAHSGIIRQTDTLRTSDENLYAHTFAASGDTWELSDISPEQLLTDTTGKYRFAGILLGKEDASGTVTPAPAADTVQSLTFGAVTDTAYGYYLNEDKQRLLNGNDIYFVYYEQPTIRYMLDNPKNRELIEIDPLQKNHIDFTRGSVQIAQNELVPVVPEQETLVSQLSTPSSPAFLIPDLLDHNGKEAALDLAEIGIRNADGSLTRSTRELVYLSYENAALQYHFGTGEPPQPFANDLTVYAIYRIRGCCLTLTKTVGGDAGGAENLYSFTIRSDALNDGAYYIGGYGDAETITAVDQAITLTIPSGSSVTLYGLAQGSYTVTETTTGIFHVIAKVDGEAVPVMDNTTAFYIGKDTDVEIINLYPIPVTGAGESGTVYLYFLFFIALAAAVLFCRQHFNQERMSTMKKKTMQRVMASMTALMAGIAMTVSVYAGAVDSPTIDTPPAHKLETSSVQAEIPVNKDIVLFNAEELYIHEPNITYTYEIMPADVTNAEIVTKNTTDNTTDNTTTTLAVRPGILEAITAIADSGNADAVMTEGEGKKTGTITFGLDNVTKKKTNPEATPPIQVSLDYKYRKNMSITVDASKIYRPTGATTTNSPGVYRYKITDVTTADTFTQSGVTDGGAPDTIYLDVYVKNNEENNGLEVYGYVLLRDTADADNLSITYTEEKIPETVKIEGFVTKDEGTVMPADLKADSYHTFNVHVSKQVVGNLADRNHKFPFKVELTNDIVTSEADFSVNNRDTHTDNKLSAAGQWDSVTNQPDGITFQFKHGDVFNFIGLPAGTKIKVSETNDTENTYAISVVGNGSSLDVKKVGSDTVSTSVTAAEGETAVMDAAYAISLGTTGDQIVVTNTLRDISVTGLLLDIAPFIFITATGVILLAFYMGGKRKNDAVNKI